MKRAIALFILAWMLAAVFPCTDMPQAAEPRDRVRRAAENALGKLREQKQAVPAEIISLRETVFELKEENQKLREDVDDIKKRLDAGEKMRKGWINWD